MTQLSDRFQLKKRVRFSQDAEQLAPQMKDLALDVQRLSQLVDTTKDIAAIVQRASTIVGQLFYSVKDYGAAGDGATDDTAAIQAACDAATAFVYGGIVALPAGNYRITANIVTDGRVSLAGAGPLCTSITVDAATSDCLVLNPAFLGHIQTQTISGITFRHGQANSGSFLVLGGATYLVVNCEFGDPDNLYSNGNLVRDSNQFTWAWFEDCVFYPASESALVFTNFSPTVHVVGCDFEVQSASYTPTNGGVIYGFGIFVDNCDFYSGATAGTHSFYKANSTDTYGQVTSSRFIGSSGAAVTCIDIGTYTASAWFSESNNVFDPVSTAYRYTTTAAAVGANVQLHTRERRTKRYSTDAATLTLEADQYGSLYVDRTGAAACTYTTNPAPEGATARVVLYSSGGAGAGVQTMDFKGEGAAVAILTTRLSTFPLMQVVLAGALAWVSVGTSNLNVAQ